MKITHVRNESRILATLVFDRKEDGLYMGWSFPTTKTVEIQNAYGPKFREMPVSKKESVRFAKTRLTKITEIPGKMKVPNLKILAYVEGSDDLGVYEELKPVRLSQIIQEWINHEELVYAQLV